MCLRSGPKAAKNFLNLETAEVGLALGSTKYLDSDRGLFIYYQEVSQHRKPGVCQRDWLYDSNLYEV